MLLFCKIKSMLKLSLMLSLIMLTLLSTLSCATVGANADSHEANTVSTIPAYFPRFGREKPIIAVVGVNLYTELTDYVIPYGVMSESNVAQVIALSTQEGELKMMPALRIQAQATVLEFDKKFPKGADYVFVPAVHNTEDPDLIGWIIAQSNKGATIIGVCDGVQVVANAGLLKQRKAVGHWYSFENLKEEFTDTEWVRNTRYIADKKVITTTGVTASIPVSIALVEAIAGTDKANLVARSLGVDNWGVEHQSDQFNLKAKNIMTIASNWLRFWAKDKIGIPVNDGVDDIMLALTADAYSRTYRSTAYLMSQSKANVVSKRGLTFLSDITPRADDSVDRIVEIDNTVLPAYSLDVSLEQIRNIYGARTADIVTLTMEYPKKAHIR